MLTFTKCHTAFNERGYEKLDKVVGVVKEIDNLGRIVIPKEFRKRLSLEDSVEILLIEEGILIRNPKYKLVKIEDISEDEKTENYTYAD